MGTVITIDPVTRIEGHLKVKVTLDNNNTVTSAQMVGNLYRDFENLLKGRTPHDATLLTQRICGICPISHAIAASKAVEAAGSFTVNMQAILLRNLIEGANYLSNHILHFYHLSLLDYIIPPQASPLSGGYTADMRFSQAETQNFMNHYLEAFKMRMKAQEACALFSGKIPHAQSIVPGGVTSNATQAAIDTFKTVLTEIRAFIDITYYNDVNKLATTYSDYFSIGRGYGNLLSYGVFETDTSTGGNPYFPSGIVTNGVVQQLSRATMAANIREYVSHSWYSSPSGQAPASGTTTPNFGKSGAYTWLKAPRYNNLPYETGTLARMQLKGSYTRGISTMDRHVARQQEASILAAQMGVWINAVTPETPIAGVFAAAFANGPAAPSTGSGLGLTDAPRGALGHWISISNTPPTFTTAAPNPYASSALASSKNINNATISTYQIITPTCWNASPVDDSGNMGPMEKALIGLHVQDPAQPVELLRVVHSFDPCTDCAVHVISPTGEHLSAAKVSTFF